MTQITRALGMRRLLSAGLAAALLSTAIGAVPAGAGVQEGTTTTMSVAPNPVVWAQDWTLQATVTANGPADGSHPFGYVRWYRNTETTPLQLGIASLTSGETETSAVMNDTLPVGTYEVFAEFSSDNGQFSGSATGIYEVTVSRVPTTVDFGTGEPEVGLGETIHLTAIVNLGTADNTGSIAFYQVGNPTPICTKAVEYQSATGCEVPPPASLGTYEFYSEYLGGDLTAPVTSETVEVTVVPNSIKAFDVDLEYGTFYPVNDGYRDTVKAHGYRDEDASVTIKFYSPGGSLIKTASISLGIGDYAYAWDGRNGAGNVLPEGEYKVRQTIEDVYGTTKTFTDFVKLSRKKLIWHSASISKDGDAFSAKGKSGDGSVAVNTSAGAVRLRTPDGFDGDWAGVGYQFSLKEALAYKDVRVAVYTTRALAGGPTTQVGAQDFDDCAYSTGPWSGNCFDKWESIDFSTSKQWTRTNALTERHLAGRKVRSMVSNGSGTTYVYKARVTYKYGTLGY